MVTIKGNADKSAMGIKYPNFSGTLVRKKRIQDIGQW